MISEVVYAFYHLFQHPTWFLWAFLGRKIYKMSTPSDYTLSCKASHNVEVETNTNSVWKEEDVLSLHLLHCKVVSHKLVFNKIMIVLHKSPCFMWLLNYTSFQWYSLYQWLFYDCAHTLKHTCLVRTEPSSSQDLGSEPKPSEVELSYLFKLK